MKKIAENFFKGNKKVRIIRSELTDIHFNLATEEYIYEKSKLEFPTLFLWRNDKSVIIGRHQNQWKECFIQRMEDEKIKLARRKTGGGSVYHDLGNSCYSFFSPVYTQYSPLDAKAVNHFFIISL
jgi:lipoate-protein ligase A